MAIDEWRDKDRPEQPLATFLPALTGSVEYVGPFEYQDVIVEGRRVPHLEAIPLPGGKVHLTVDRRFGLDLSLADAERVVPFVAHAIAIGMGYVGLPEGDADAVPAQPFPRTHWIGGPEEGPWPAR
jgi:hypothetical protein